MSDFKQLELAIGKARSHVRNGLVKKEADVRSGIVAPVLRSLGWDPNDLASVRREFSVPGGRLDYALLTTHDDVAFAVETKPPGNVDVGATDQLMRYAGWTKARLGLITDGQVWSFYLPLAEGNPNQKRIQTVDLNDGKLADVLVRYMARDRVLSGEAVKAAEEDRENIGLESAVSAAWDLLKQPRQDLVALLAKEAAKHMGTRKANMQIKEGARNFLVKELRTARAADARSPTNPEPKRRVTGKKPPVTPPGSPVEKAQWTYGGTRHAASTFSNAYVEIITQIANDHGGIEFYRLFQSQFTRRKHKQVAPTSSEAGLTTRELPGGWHLSTHSSTAEKKRLLARACEAAGLVFGQDLVLGAGW